MNSVKTAVGHDENQVFRFCSRNQKINDCIGIQEKMGVNTATL